MSQNRKACPIGWGRQNQKRSADWRSENIFTPGEAGAGFERAPVT
jgi:hypothetical protein